MYRNARDFCVLILYPLTLLNDTLPQCSVHCSSVYNSQDMEATLMSINRWMDEEVVVHVYNGILLGHKKERIWVSWTEVDEPRVYYTEWSKSEIEKQILCAHVCIYIWNLEKRYSWTYFQGRNRDTNVENKSVDTAREGDVGWEERVALSHVHHQWKIGS